MLGWRMSRINSKGFETALRLALQWPYDGWDKRGKCRGIARAQPGAAPGKTAGHRLSSTGPEVPGRHSDTAAPWMCAAIPVNCRQHL